VPAQVEASAPAAARVPSWHTKSPDEIASLFGVDTESGLSSAQAAQLLGTNGPNALPEERPRRAGADSSTSTAAICGSSWWGRDRFPGDQEWSTAALLFLLTLLTRSLACDGR
jgi:Ca2+-transporting ATPase